MTLDVEFQAQPMTLDVEMGQVVSAGTTVLNESPYIGDNGNWFAWDEDTKTYGEVPSGMKALYDFVHKREIAQAEKITNLQNLFKK